MSYQRHTQKSELDQFYTNPDYAKYCFEVTKPWHTDKFIEPCAGTGSFFNQMPHGSLGYDLEPHCDGGVISGNFLEVDTNLAGYTCVSNPPFGVKNSLSVKFFNHLGNLGCDVIAMVLPRSFRKASVINKLHRSYELVYDEDSPKNAFVLNGKPYDVRCCLQVWKRIDTQRDKIDTSGNNPWFDWVGREDGYDYALINTYSRAGSLCDDGKWTDRYCSFIKLKMITKEQFIEAYSKIKWREIHKSNCVSIEHVTKSEFVKLMAEHLDTMLQPLIDTDTTNPYFEFCSKDEADCCYMRNGGKAGSVFENSPNHSANVMTFIKLKTVSFDQFKQASLVADFSCKTNTPAMNGLNKKEFTDAMVAVLSSP